MNTSQTGWRSLKVAFYLISAVAALSAPALAQKQTARYVSNEVLIKFKSEKTDALKREIVGRLRSSIQEKLGDLGWVRVKLANGKSVEDAIKAYGKMAEVDAVQPNYYYQLQTIPNDPLWTDQYFWGMAKISAPAAWDLSTGSSDVVVADIDTGIDYTHEDLVGNVWTNPGEIPNNGIDDDNDGFVDDYYGYDFRYNDPDPMDEYGHGTHTAGTIGAVGNNGIGVVGVCWHVKIMGIKIYSATADDTTSAMVINAYNYVRMMKNRGVNIVATNNSYGGCPETCGSDLAVKDGIDAMGAAGILNVFAAGNSGTNNDTDPFYPASYDSPSIVSVGGTDVNDNRVFNYGPNTVDLAAPAQFIRSTIPMYNGVPYYRVLSGTSMATPHVTGAAALLASYNPSLSAASIKATLMNTVDVLPQFQGFYKSGGRLNVFNALQHQTVCSFNLDSSTINVPTKGGDFSMNVTAAQNCDYAVKSNASWVSVSSSDSMSGNGTVTFHVRVNPTITRDGTVSVGSSTLTVHQSRQ
jgi:subtilisin family serine protease